MIRIAYFRVSTKSQDLAAQKTAAGTYDEHFEDEGVSGAVLAADRPGFAALLKRVRAGDTVWVYAVDRLGRDSIDIQTTVKKLMAEGVTVEIHGLGKIEGEMGKVLLAMLAQLAELERARILERCESGRTAARESLARTGKTHHGKDSLGRPAAANAGEVVAWRKANGKDGTSASIAATAKHFGLSDSTVKRYCEKAAKAA